MKPIQRNEILDYMTYIDHRDGMRENVMIEKNRRRIHVGDDLTFLFENRDTMRYQIQEMMRIERLVREEDIEHEINTYNDVLGGDGELGCTLLIEIDDVDERNSKLRQWVGLPNHLYARLDDGSKVYAKFDTKLVDTNRLSAVQYIKFNTAGKAPVAMGTDHPDLTLETELSDDQMAALKADLAT
ncbi:MAG TPA: DUF3501 domain-containing protein [Candidatus Marinimicrobia bacterium]|nr:MAG: hypothetical protein AUJ47_13160 [Candidatus Marinimicrobia bacterium CG1_02_48_14]PJA54537.1 MAG: DUF3501 domain-containing protein [Candidatus Marinimicrobia bacterium CG_4_9_14_3_um_filter_48_9]HCW75662.1 DUF3501 domain-containing protein [Candidatus Neomarinimicrobiota bacterium]